MKLEGKVINFLGDSITEGTGVTDTENNRYDNIIFREHKLKAVNNYGIGGTRIAHQEKPSEKPRYDLCFCGRAYNVDFNADVTVIYGGVNDYIHGDAPIGQSTDTTPATFWGGVNFLMNFFKSNYNGQVVFLTPAHGCLHGISDEVISDRPMKKPDAMPLRNYVEIIKEAGNAHGVPVLDMFELPINVNNPDDREKYTIDGLHFNDEGHKIIAKYVGDFLLSI